VAQVDSFIPFCNPAAQIGTWSLFLLETGAVPASRLVRMIIWWRSYRSRGWYYASGIKWNVWGQI